MVKTEVMVTDAAKFGKQSSYISHHLQEVGMIRRVRAVLSVWLTGFLVFAAVSPIANIV
jgi:hypothetical protein